ncbi:MAG: putative DNA binding domain-containing protein, partial [Bdellovibrionales bacterium]|nr:putative DNA binding domain-containing protein [Bdellovibrionales bacterium]
TEWVEFKHNNSDREEIGEYISALANSAVLHHRPAGYILWGIDDATHQIVGTTFNPHHVRVGNEELENWLLRQLSPRPNLFIHELGTKQGNVILFEIAPATHTPVRFRDTEFIRVGSYKKKLRDFPEKERYLWQQFQMTHFEEGIARHEVETGEVLSLLDYPAYFEMTGQSLPAAAQGIIDRLRDERLIVSSHTGHFDITNLGAILFAKDLTRFNRLSRKMLRIIVYRDRNRVQTMREHQITSGYATGFVKAVEIINTLLPVNEQIAQAYRLEKRDYPEIAVRELVANALIHQDFLLTGTGPVVEIFSDRVEVTNPGIPLIEPLRFIDQPPRSRNEQIAAFMRRINICEERGSGIDKIISEVEISQLPPPDFRKTDEHTVAILYAQKTLNEMTPEERRRACYQHACLLYVSNERMTNATLRARLGIEDHNYATASRIMTDTIKAALVKPYDPDSLSRKHASYVPFWA